MDWERKKFLIELEVKRLELEKEKLLKWISFLQTAFLLVISATVSVLYKTDGEFTRWVVGGIILSFSILLILLWNYRKVDRLKKELYSLEEKLKC
jgi:hypothetical protein